MLFLHRDEKYSMGTQHNEIQRQENNGPKRPLTLFLLALVSVISLNYFRQIKTYLLNGFGTESKWLCVIADLAFIHFVTLKN